MNKYALSFNDKVSTYKILIGLNENRLKKSQGTFMSIKKTL